MTDDTPLNQSGTITVGEDLYGVSIHELEARIVIFNAEIARVERELTKKRAEREAADSVFGGKK
jgi:uncharacterized small protein (DUF1192 family)